MVNGERKSQESGARRKLTIGHWPLTINAGGVLVSRIVLSDISERKQMEKTLKIFQSIIETSDDAIISKTMDGIITSWNPGAERIFGYMAEEVIGKPMTMWLWFRSTTSRRLRKLRIFCECLKMLNCSLSQSLNSNRAAAQNTSLPSGSFFRLRYHY